MDKSRGATGIQRPATSTGVKRDLNSEAASSLRSSVAQSKTGKTPAPPTTSRPATAGTRTIPSVRTEAPSITPRGGTTSSAAKSHPETADLQAELAELRKTLAAERSQHEADKETFQHTIEELQQRLSQQDASAALSDERVMQARRDERKKIEAEVLQIVEESKTIRSRCEAETSKIQLESDQKVAAAMEEVVSLRNELEAMMVGNEASQDLRAKSLSDVLQPHSLRSKLRTLDLVRKHCSRFVDILKESEQVCQSQSKLHGPVQVGTWVAMNDVFNACRKYYEEQVAEATRQIGETQTKIKELESALDRSDPNVSCFLTVLDELHRSSAHKMPQSLMGDVNVIRMVLQGKAKEIVENATQAIHDSQSQLSTPRSPSSDRETLSPKMLAPPMPSFSSSQPTAIKETQPQPQPQHQYSRSADSTPAPLVGGGSSGSGGDRGDRNLNISVPPTHSRSLSHPEMGAGSIERPMGIHANVQTNNAFDPRSIIFQTFFVNIEGKIAYEFVAPSSTTDPVLGTSFFGSEQLGSSVSPAMSPRVTVGKQTLEPILPLSWHDVQFSVKEGEAYNLGLTFIVRGPLNKLKLALIYRRHLPGKKRVVFQMGTFPVSTEPYVYKTEDIRAPSGVLERGLYKVDGAITDFEDNPVADFCFNLEVARK